MQDDPPASGSRDARGSRLPKQLSPAMLTVLLEDLIEYNGISYRTVPLRTFREKYIGLYFARFNSDRCRMFLQHLKAFYVVMNHKFECVLVSCDGSDEDYTHHVQLTLWPTYPPGDYRALLLRKHFEVDECPRLIILDPNGMVVTSNGVERVEQDQMALNFPWCNRIVEKLWGERIQGQLKYLLDDLMLPEIDGVDAAEHDVVGLIFGEPWCPETRDLIRRAAYLMDRVSSRPRVGSAEQEDRHAIYYVHSESLENYRRFPDFYMPFPTVHLQDEEKRLGLLHFLGVGEPPAFRILAPEEGWTLHDAEGWLRKDPGGILFPWKQQPAALDEPLEVDLPNAIRPLDEASLNEALCQGPVFIAFLHKVHTRRAEALATLRAAAMAFMAQGHMDVRSDRRSTEETPTRDRRVSCSISSRLMSMEDKAARKTLMNTFKKLGHHDDVDGRKGMESLRKNLSRPCYNAKPRANLVKDGSADRRSTFDADQKVLWRTKIVDRQHDLAHGAAPWNAKGDLNVQRESLMTFFYTIADDRAASLLGKFCCFDATQLHQHQMWLAAQSARYAENERAWQEMRERLVQLSELAASVTSPSQAGAAASRGRANSLRGSSTPSQPSIPDGGGPANSMVDAEAQRGDLHVRAEPGQAMSRDVHYQPRARYSALGELTEELLGNGEESKGSALIIDMARGAYHVCGSLTDEGTVIRFLDGWVQGALDPFEISLLNSEEMLHDDENEVARQLVAGTHGKLGPSDWMDLLPRPMPAIVIWIPTKQHAEMADGPAALYRALLHYAYRKCPREDGAVSWAPPGAKLEPDDHVGLPREGLGERLTPWVEKLWIFGLLAGPAAEAEEGCGAWQPPPLEFLSDLNLYVNKLVKKQALDDDRNIRATTSGTPRIAMPMTLGVGPTESGPRPATPSRRGAGREGERASEMLIERSHVFDDGLQALRGGRAEERFNVEGNYNLCMRTATTRRELYAMMLDELSFHGLVQYPPPPLFVLLAADLPPYGAVPWPSFLQMAHVHVVGHTPDPASYRELSPSLERLDWERWTRNSVDPTIPASVSKYISVPWQ